MGADQPPSSDPALSGRATASLRSPILLKLTVFISGLLVLTTALLIWSGYVFTRQLILGQIRDRLEVVANDRRFMLLSFLRQQSDRIALIAGRSRLNALMCERDRGALKEATFREEAGEVLRDVQESTEGLVSLRLVDRSGKVLAAGDEALLGLDCAASPDFQEGLRGRHLGLPVLAGGKYTAAIAHPVVSPAGQTLGVVMASADLSHLVQFLIDANGMGETGEVLIGTRRGDRIRFLFPSRLSPTVREFTPQHLSPMADATRGGGGFRETNDYRGVPVLAAYRAVGLLDWGLVAKMDVQEAFEPFRHFGRILISLEAGILFTGMVAAYALARRFTQPLVALSETAARVASGDLEARVAVTSKDELGALGSAFNRMTEELSRSYATLERRVSARTRDLEASRDLLDEFFTISTSQQDPHNLEKTFDSVLRCCTRLGYDLAMLSLVDGEGGVVRGVRAAGAMAGIVDQTVRPLDGDDVLAVAVREGRTLVIPDTTEDPHCEPVAAAKAGVRGMVVVPLRGEAGEILGTLQVATRGVLERKAADPRPLETLAGHAARALLGLRQLGEIQQLNRRLEERAWELARSEASLRQQTQILQSILDCMGDGVSVSDENGAFLLFNPAARRILRMGPVNLTPDLWSRQYGLYLADRVTPVPADEIPLVRASRGESVDDQEMFIRHNDLPGGIWISVTARPLRDAQGALIGGVAVFRDVTGRKLAEQRLAVQHSTTRVLAESSTLGDASPQILAAIGASLGYEFGALWRLDTRRQVLRLVETWHRPGAPPARFDALKHLDQFTIGAGLPGRVWERGGPCWVADVRQDEGLVRRPVLEEAGLRSAFGFPVLLKGDVIGVVEFFGDEVRLPDAKLIDLFASLGSQIGQFLERHQMHGRLVQAEKLASLGLLSAGVAHEINNPLAYIANNLFVVERDVRSLKELLAVYDSARDALKAACPETADAIDRLAEEIDLPYLRQNIEPILASTRAGVKRVADIVQNLRTFTRIDQATTDRVNIHEAILGGLEIIRGRLQRRGIEVEQKFGDLPLVSCAPAQLNQVFLNLVVNAMQAIEATGRADGRIEICTRPGEGVVLVEVADNGCGIPAHELPRIFDPFYTTKAVGEGTGLGLSITHGIVSDHGGRIEVDSTIGQGTRFRVILPIGEKGKAR